MERDDLFERITDFVKYFKELPSVKDCGNHGIPSYYIIKQHGGFKEIFEELKLEKPDLKPELLESLIKYYKEQGAWPKTRDCPNCKYLYSHNMYVTHFDSWTNAINQAAATLIAQEAQNDGFYD